MWVHGTPPTIVRGFKGEGQLIARSRAEERYEMKWNNEMKWNMEERHSGWPGRWEKKVRWYDCELRIVMWGNWTPPWKKPLFRPVVCWPPWCSWSRVGSRCLPMCHLVLFRWTWCVVVAGRGSERPHGPRPVYGAGKRCTSHCLLCWFGTTTVSLVCGWFLSRYMPIVRAYSIGWAYRGLKSPSLCGWPLPPCAVVWYSN